MNVERVQRECEQYPRATKRRPSEINSVKKGKREISAGSSIRRLLPGAHSG